jgi:drug/metabolite transporter (DMT)-like permease
MPRQSAYLADAALVGVTLVWGSTFVVIKDALPGVGPFEFVAMRFGLAFLALVAIFHRKLTRIGRADLRAGAVIGTFLLLGYILQTAGLQFTTASRAGFITGLSVLIVPLFAYLALRQPIGIGIGLGVILAAIGMWLLSFDGPATFGVGEVLVLACAVAFAAHIVSISAYASRHDPIALVIVQIGFVAIVASLVAALVEHPSFALPPGPTLFGAAYTGVLGSALVLGIQTNAQRYTTPSHAAVIFSLEPVFAALFAFALAGESLGPRGLLGGAMILAAMLVAEVKR